jgi:CHAT domain-containing protein
VEPESYLGVAVTEWLPRRWEGEKYERVLTELATRFEQRHGDRWLRDMLAARRSKRLDAGMAALAKAVQANLADDDLALVESVEAADKLRASDSQAGALHAEFDEVYALRTSAQSARKGLLKAIAVERKAEAMKYAWIRGQAILEEGNCHLNLGNSGEARRDFARALVLVRDSGYGDLELRAEGLLAAAGTTSGDLVVAWDLSRTELGKYWSGSYSGNRAQQIYFNLWRASVGLGERQAAYVFIRAAAQAIAETPRRGAEALTRAILAELALEAQRPEEAAAEFNRAGALFDPLPPTPNGVYPTSAELYRAEAEIALGTPQAAVQRLEKIRTATEDVDAAPLQIRFQELLGNSLGRSGSPDRAETAYRRAIELNEHMLSTIQGSRRRAEQMVTGGKAYRRVVELLWDRGDSDGALRLWEWFRAAEVPGPRGAPDLDQRRARLHSESFLSYVILPDGGVAAWLFDDRDVHGLRLAVKREELEAVAYRFLRECADLASDTRAIRRDARQLYEWLVAPLADHLDQSRTLVIEPDGPVGAIPMQALMDDRFQYLGERFAIASASGLADYQHREALGTVDADVRALVVANPALGEQAVKTFPALAGTMHEGESVVKRFHNAVPLMGRRATLAAVERERRTAELFHFAGHGFSNAGNGGLLLSPDDPSSTGASVLDGNGLADQAWSHCRLAVLSACSTGTGEAGPVNPESLVRGFLWAGVARVVASRWNVDTQTGVPFMDQFYSDLLSGDRPATALQQAARQVRQKQETSHPYFWAGFQIFGAR